MTKTLTVTTKSGKMTFSSKASAWEFFLKISTFQGFTKETLPRNVEEAVEYHLTFERSGLEGVFALIRHTEEMQAIAKAEKSARYAAAQLAPRDSHVYRSHFDSRYGEYLWGS
jgi:hypothetical protein